MKKLILIGKWFKGKKSTVIDLQAYREMKGKGESARMKAEGMKTKAERGRQEDSKIERANKEPKTKKKRYPWDFLI